MAGRAASPSMTPAQAVAALASQAVFGDGSVTAEEEEALRSRLKGFPDLWRQESVEAALKAVGERMRRLGVEPVLQEAMQAVPVHLEEPLMVTLRELVAADGESSEDEDDLITTLGAAFGERRKRLGAGGSRRA